MSQLKSRFQTYRRSILLAPLRAKRLLWMVWSVQLCLTMLLVMPISVPLASQLNYSLEASQMTGFFGDPMMVDVALSLQPTMKELAGAYVLTLPLILLAQIFCYGGIFALLSSTDASSEGRATFTHFLREGGARFGTSLRLSLCGVGMTLLCMIPYFALNSFAQKYAMEGLHSTAAAWLKFCAAILGGLLFLLSRVWLDLARARALSTRTIAVLSSVGISARQLFRQPVRLCAAYALAGIPWALLGGLLLLVRMAIPEPGIGFIVAAFVLGQGAILCRTAITLACAQRALTWVTPHLT